MGKDDDNDSLPDQGEGQAGDQVQGLGKGMGKVRGADEQEEVLPQKGNVTEGSRGLQQWGDEAIPEGPVSGTGSSGTAERAAKITQGQLDAEAKKRPDAG